MRVYELIRQLQKLPQHLTVYVSEEGSVYEYTAISKVTVSEFKWSNYESIRMIDPAAEQSSGTAVILR